MERIFRSLLFRSVIICILSTSYSATILGKDPNLDSLKSLIRIDNTDISQVDLLNDIAFIYNKSDLDTTFHYASIALEKAKKLSYVIGEARALNLVSGKYLYKKDYDTSIQLNEEALQLVKDSSNHKILSQIYNTLAVNYYYMQDQARSIALLQRSLDESKLAKDSLSTVIISTNIGFLHLENNELDLVEDYLNESAEISEKIDYTLGKTLALRNLGTLYYKRGNKDKAIALYQKGLALSVANDDHFNTGHINLLLGKAYHENQMYNEALSYYFEAVKHFKIRKEDQTTIDCYFQISELYFDTQKYEDAMQYANLGKDLADTDATFEHQVRYSELMANAYEAKNNLPLAFKYQKELKSWSDSLYNREKKQKVNELERKYQLQRIDVENQLLKEEKAKQSAVISEQKTRTIAFVIFSLLASALAFVLYRSIKASRNYSTKLEQVVQQRTLDLKVANNELKRSNEELESFAYIASHDLKEPLRNISTFSQLIKKELGEKTNTKLDSYIGIINGMTEQMNFLVTGILQYSKTANARDYKPVDLNLICKNVQEYLKVQIDEKRAKITVDRLPTIMANEAQIFQVFKNLIENGIKYTTCCQPQIHVKYEEDKNLHAFSITDNGIGIDEKYLDQIFEMFNRLHNRSEFKGAGLGLSIVKKIVHGMGGDITVESMPGEGSVFKFTLPKKQIKEENLS